MALVVKDRVKETTATTGDGTLTLAGALTGFQSFSSALSDGDTTYYAIFESSTGEFEVGLGTFTASGTTLSRDTVLSSSNSGSKISLTAGSAEVFITQPATKSAYFDASGDLVLNQDPTSALQAATKQYVDTIAAAGIHYHDPVRVEQEGNLNATYDNGTSGVGATLTNAGTQAALVIDGVTMVLNDRVLIYEQTNAAHNGIYTVTNVGSASTNWVLTRATDADSYSPSDPDALGQGDAFFVSEGAAGAGETYVMTTEGTITFGTTDITFSQISATQIYSAGDGLTLTGTTFAAGAGTGVTVNANDIAIGQDVGTGSNVTFNQVTAAVVGNVTGDVTGNAGTATALETARTIGGVSFDGTANIDLPGVNTAGNQDTSGNAATATALATGRTISLTGDVTGTSGSFDGSGNVSIAATIAANSVALGTDTTGNYVADISAGTLIDVSGGGSETATVTVNVDLSELTTSTSDGDGDFFVVVDSVNAQKKLTKGNINISGFNNDAGYTTNVGDITGVTAGSFITGGGTSGTVTVNVDATSANTASKVVARDASGNFSAGTITAALSGNATTATTLATGRTISLTGDVTGTSGSFDGSGNVSIAATIAANSVALGTDTTGNYVAAGATSGNGISGSVSSEGGTFTVTSNATNANTASTLVFRDASGNFSAGTITANLTGTASSATNADTVDSLHASQFLRSDAADSTSSTISFTGDIEVGDQIFHHGDADTYMQFHNANEWRVVTGGTEMLEVNDTNIIASANLDINADINGVDNIYLAGTLYHEGDTDTYLSFGTNTIALRTGGTDRLNISDSDFTVNSAVKEDYDALSGTTPTIDVDTGGGFSLTTSGNTTFTFSSFTSGVSCGFVLELTAGGAHTITWPASVDWAGGTAPDAPASGETDIYVFWTRDGGTTWYGVQSIDAAA